MAFTDAHPKDAARIKIERAKEHAQELNRLVGVYIDSDPYTFTIKLDPDGTQRAILETYKPIPGRFSAIIGDIIHNSRSALDAVATYGGFVETNSIENLKFPIFSDSATFQKKAFNNFPDCPRTKRFIERLKPYERGDNSFTHSDALVMLNRLSVRDKHTSIIPMGAVVARAVVTPVSGWTDQPFEIVMESYSPVAESGEIFVWRATDPRFAGKQLNTQITLKVVLHGVETTPAINATSLLMHLVSVVDRVVGLAERRLYP